MTPRVAGRANNLEEEEGIGDPGMTDTAIALNLKALLLDTMQVPHASLTLPSY
jgi:hypothetical protein